MNKKWLLVPAALLILTATTAGSCDVQKDAPEPTPDNIINGTQTQVIQMPDGFRNLGFTCHGTVGLYVTSRGWVQASADKNITPLPSDVTAVLDHPRCKGQS